jgi:hypothetical protein
MYIAFEIGPLPPILSGGWALARNIGAGDGMGFRSSATCSEDAALRSLSPPTARWVRTAAGAGVRGEIAPGTMAAWHG